MITPFLSCVCYDNLFLVSVQEHVGLILRSFSSLALLVTRTALLWVGTADIMLHQALTAKLRGARISDTRVAGVLELLLCTVVTTVPVSRMWRALSRVWLGLLEMSRRHRPVHTLLLLDSLASSSRKCHILQIRKFG